MSKLQPVIFDIGWNACINCGACVAICPQEAGFISPFDTIAVDRPCDIACLLCENICPTGTISHRPVAEGDPPRPPRKGELVGTPTSQWNERGTDAA